jgi:hypothetical protein
MLRFGSRRAERYFRSVSSDKFSTAPAQICTNIWFLANICHDITKSCIAHVRFTFRGYTLLIEGHVQDNQVSYIRIDF